MQQQVSQKYIKPRDLIPQKSVMVTISEVSNPKLTSGCTVPIAMVRTREHIKSYFMYDV